MYILNISYQKAPTTTTTTEAPSTPVAENLGTLEFVNQNISSSISSFGGRKSLLTTFNLIYDAADCDDINDLCQMEPAFLLDILCQIETVREQCPKRCNSCPELVGKINFK